MTQSQDVFSNNMKRNARREDKSNMSLVSVSTASSNLSDVSQHRNIVLDQCQQFPAQMSSLAQDSCATVSTQDQSSELVNSATVDPNKTQCEFALANEGFSQLESDERLSPEQSTELPSTQTKTVAPDLLSPISQHTPYNQIVIAEPFSALPGSRSPQLEQFIQDILDATLSESSDESPEVGDCYFKMVRPSAFEDLPPEKPSPTEDTSTLREGVPSVTQSTEDSNQTDVAVTTPTFLQESFQTGLEVVPVPLNQTKISEATDSFISSEFVKTPKSQQSPCGDRELSFDSSFTFNVAYDSKCDDSTATETCSSSAFSKVSAKSHMSEEHEADLRKQGSTTGILQELHESYISSEGVEEGSTTGILKEFHESSRSEGVEESYTTAIVRKLHESIGSEGVEEGSPTGILQELHASYGSSEDVEESYTNGILQELHASYGSSEGVEEGSPTGILQELHESIGSSEGVEECSSTGILKELHESIGSSEGVEECSTPGILKEIHESYISSEGVEEGSATGILHESSRSEGVEESYTTAIVRKLHESIGSSEGVEEGSPTGILQELHASYGSSEGVEEGSPTGILQELHESIRSPEGVEEGSPTGILQELHESIGLSEGVEEGSPTGILQELHESIRSPEGVEEGSPTGILQELHESIRSPEGVEEGSPTGILQELHESIGSSEGVEEGSPTGILQELHESIGSSEGVEEGSPTGILQELHESIGSSEGVEEGSPTAILQELHESIGSSEGVEEGSPTGILQELHESNRSEGVEEGSPTGILQELYELNRSEGVEEGSPTGILQELHESIGSSEGVEEGSPTGILQELHELNRSEGVEEGSTTGVLQELHESNRSEGVEEGSPTGILQELYELNRSEGVEEGSPTGILQELHESNRSEGVEGETSTKSLQDQLPYLFEAVSLESLQTEDSCSQSLSDLTPETVTSAKHFSFGEPMPYPCAGNFDLFWDEDRTTTHHSGEYLTVIDESLASQSAELDPRAEGSSSTSDEDYSIPPGYEEITVDYQPRPSRAAEVVHCDTDSPVFEYSDPESYFDCKQAASDFSEVEPDEPKMEMRSSGARLQDHSVLPEESNKLTEKILLSSGSEDYEDAPYVPDQSQNLRKESEEESVHCSDTSDEEFTLCEASQLLPDCETAACKDDNKSLAREVAAELGEVSESSDEEFLTTRIVRRRVVIQADKMPDLPEHSVTEEKYKDENGHIVVKRVTRKIIRKCVSADGAERVEVSSAGARQEWSGTSEGDGYSKVVKRTVLKSEGDHAEVTFDECEGLSAPQQGAVGSCRFSRVERTTVVGGERTATHQGDPSLASDLPSAQDDFKQALGYINVFNREGLPHVVEREIVKEDGTVVRRAHMHEGRTSRRTVVKGAGRRKRVFRERVDNPAEGTKPHELQHHLHQLFHRYLDEEEEDSEEEE